MTEALSEAELVALDLRDYLNELNSKRAAIAAQAETDTYVWARSNLEAHDAEIARVEKQLADALLRI